MNATPTLTHALRPEEKQNKVELRRSLRRSIREPEPRLSIFGSKLEIALFSLAAVALLATPLVRASFKAKDELVEIATRLRTPAAGDDAIITGSIPAARPVVVRPAPDRSAPADDRPALRGTL